MSFTPAGAAGAAASAGVAGADAGAVADGGGLVGADGAGLAAAGAGSAGTARAQANPAGEPVPPGSWVVGLVIVGVTALVPWALVRWRWRSLRRTLVDDD